MPDDRICGLNAVTALFARRPDDVIRLFYNEENKSRVGPLCAELARVRRPYRLLPPDEMERAAGTPHHGGVVAIATSRPLGMMDFVRPPRFPLLLILDSVGNPHNLGAIARSAAFFGVRAMVLHETPLQAMPSDAAYRVAEGGLEYLEVYKTRNLRKALLALDPYYRTVAATLTDDAVPVSSLPRDRPVALVLGNEERGVGFDALETCRRRIRITGSGAVQSLNVAQAAAVLLHTLTSQIA
jgi:TrmH RNA methyltransferase